MTRQRLQTVALTGTLVIALTPFGLAQSTSAANPHAGSPAARRSAPLTTGGFLATLTGFGDHAAWAAAVGSTTLIDFESFADGTEINAELAPFGISNVSGTSDNEVPPGPTTQWVTSSGSLPFSMFIAGTLPSETKFLSNLLLFPGGPAATGTITFEFSSPRTAVGAYYADQSPIGNQLIELFDGALSLGSICLPGAALPNSFVGVISTSSFTSCKFYAESPFDSWGLDNLEFSGSSSLGTNYCSVVPNSSGSPALMSAFGSASVAANNLTLEAQPVPQQPGLFYYGPLQTQLVFGNGFRCVSGQVGRLTVSSPIAGVLSHALDVTNPPSIAVLITAGSTWNFQAWYRDPAAGGASFNLSDGLEVTFTP